MIGMYERDNLGMEIGGLEFSKKNIHQWRSNFAYVDQNCRLFDASVAENITLGSNRDVNEDQIKEAAKRALAHNFIVGFEDGYATGCGEKGATLSGGQNQRIAIARALYRKAPFLAFDEATASLDTDSERGIMETIESLRADHTILIATHNLDLIRSADKIVVMSQGEVVELGTHDELLNNGGTYKNMLALSQKERTIKL
jgi:ABC-type multidrug transport system fused ATPase/permease subunit